MDLERTKDVSNTSGNNVDNVWRQLQVISGQFRNDFRRFSDPTDEILDPTDEILKFEKVPSKSNNVPSNADRVSNTNRDALGNIWSN